jgi:uncharacterized protein YcaQ
MAEDDSRPFLGNAAARRLFLHRHGLAGDPAGVPGIPGLADVIERLGFVQLDSVSTVERAHHMILAARRPAYRQANLATLTERQRGLFEHWTHDASFIPIEFYPHWRFRFERDKVRLADRWKKWRRDGFEAKFDEVLDHVAKHGPIMARDLGDGEARSNQGWWDWHPSKTALEYLWRTGALAIKQRRSFQKVFDLTERVIPPDILAVEPAPEETIHWAAASAMDRLGFATLGEIAAFWETITAAQAKTWAAAHVGDDLIEIDVEGATGAIRRCFARPSVLDSAETAPEAPAAVRILSPFDPALRDRKRAEWLFGFRYRIEIFVPEAKRQYGYYVFPLLEGARVIGRIDMKRVDGAMNVRAFWPEAGMKMGKGRNAKLTRAVERMTKFAGVQDINWAPDWLKETL